MTTPGGVPNLPVGALTLDTLAQKLQDQTAATMRSLASQRIPSVFDVSNGGTILSDLTPFGIITRIWAEVNSAIANADPADINGPEDLPPLLFDFIESLPVIGELVGLLQAIGGTYTGDDAVLLAVQEIFNPVRKLLQLASGQDVGFPTVEEITVGWTDLVDAIAASTENLATVLAATEQATFAALGAALNTAIIESVSSAEFISTLLAELEISTVDQLATVINGILDGSTLTWLATLLSALGLSTLSELVDYLALSNDFVTHLLTTLSTGTSANAAIILGGAVDDVADSTTFLTALTVALATGDFAAAADLVGSAASFVAGLQAALSDDVAGSITAVENAASFYTTLLSDVGSANLGVLSSTLSVAVTNATAFAAFETALLTDLSEANLAAVSSVLGTAVTALNQISDIFNGSVVTPVNTTVQQVQDWYAANVAYLAAIPPTAVLGLSGFGTNIGTSLTALSDGVWQGLRAFLGIPSGVGPPQVSSAAQQVRVDLNNATDIATLARTIQAAQAITKQSFLSIDPSADPVFPLSNIAGASPTTVPVTQAKSVMGAILLPDVSKKKSVTWLGGPLTGITAVYVNLYKVNKTTGVFTKFHASLNIIGSLSTPVSGTAWNFYNLPMADWFDVTPDGTGGTTTTVLAIGDYVVVEIQTFGTGTYNVVGFTNGLAEHPSIYPKSLGASRSTHPFAALGAGSTGAATSRSENHVIAADDTAIVAAISTFSTSAPTLTATCGGVSMTLLGSSVFVNSGGVYEAVWIFGLLNPASSPGTGTKSVQVNSNISASIAINSVSCKNVTAFGTAQTATGTGTTPSHTVTSVAGKLVIQAFSGNLGGGSSLSAYSQTSRWNQASVGGVNIPLVIGDAFGGASSVIFAATQSSAAWGSVAVPLTLGALAPTSIASPIYDTATPWIALAGAAGRSQHAAETVEFETAGSSQTYTLPTWIEDGDYIDIVPCGAGAGGSYAGFTAGTSSPGYKGGGPGQWNPIRLRYGDDYDIPTGTTSFTVNIGAGGTGGTATHPAHTPAHGSDGGNTTVVITGYPTITALGGIKDSTTNTATEQGDTPGNVTHEGVTYFGGAGGTYLGDGSSPGGSGSYGFSFHSGPSAGDWNGRIGAPGACYVTATQA